MPRSEVQAMISKAGAPYRIYIALPEAPPPPHGYPVLYLLDGDESFAATAELANRFGRYWALEPGIVVAIGYPSASRRSLDYTPKGDPGPDVPATRPTGGADAFLSFVADELVPTIDAAYKTDHGRRDLDGLQPGRIVHPPHLVQPARAVPYLCRGEPFHLVCRQGSAHRPPRL
jgi:hypothetical protein